MIHDIGAAAGAIWDLLNKQGELPVTKIKKEVNLKDDLFYMALGWLAREDQIRFIVSGRNKKIALR